MSIKYARQLTPVAMSCIDISLRYMTIQRESLSSLDCVSFLLDYHTDLGSLSQRPDKWHENQTDNEYQNQ